jgi:hypothetical protein
MPSSSYFRHGTYISTVSMKNHTSALEKECWDGQAGYMKKTLEVRSRYEVCSTYRTCTYLVSACLSSTQTVQDLLCLCNTTSCEICTALAPRCTPDHVLTHASPQYLQSDVMACFPESEMKLAKRHSRIIDRKSCMRAVLDCLS